MLSVYRLIFEIGSSRRDVWSVNTWESFLCFRYLETFTTQSNNSVARHSADFKSIVTLKHVNKNLFVKEYLKFLQRINMLKSFRNISHVSDDLNIKISNISYFPIVRVDREVLACERKMSVWLLHYQAMNSVEVWV